MLVVYVGTTQPSRGNRSARHIRVKIVARRGYRASRPGWLGVLGASALDRNCAAYVELLLNKRKGTCAACMGSCPGFFGGMGSWDDNSSYYNTEFNDILESRRVKLKYVT